MENVFGATKNDDTDKEWSSFCSSCKSVLQSTRSVGEASFSDVTIDQETIEILGTIIEEIKGYDGKERCTENGIVLTRFKDLNDNTQKMRNYISKHSSDRRGKILKIIESILYLSNFIDVMREIILEEIRKKATDNGNNNNNNNNNNKK